MQIVGKAVSITKPICNKYNFNTYSCNVIIILSNNFLCFIFYFIL